MTCGVEVVEEEKEMEQRGEEITVEKEEKEKRVNYKEGPSLHVLLCQSSKDLK